jgi:hypothetical protein
MNVIFFNAHVTAIILTDSGYEQKGYASYGLYYIYI